MTTIKVLKKLLPAAASGVALYLVAKRLRKTQRDLNSIRYPRFVYEAQDECAPGVPVFTYHSIADADTPDSVTPADFETHIRYLVENDYHTLTADELYDYLVENTPIPARSVALTFDDGRATLWTLAYPILKKYGAKAISFLVPGAIDDAAGGGMRPNLDDCRGNTAHVFSLLAAVDMSQQSTVTWDEVRAMHHSGVIDFQSHTLDHTLIFCSSEIVDFVNPASNFRYHNFGVPVMRVEGADVIHERPAWGTPIYRSQSRMAAARRYFDDERLRDACVRYVAQRGAEDFFTRPHWRDELRQLVTDYQRANGDGGYVETAEEQERAICDSLTRSKALIETHLDGHQVRHLCFPWHRYSLMAAALARQAGYVSLFTDINPQKIAPDASDPYRVQRELPANNAGDDPFQITRIDARDNLVLSLPGKGRLSYTDRFRSRLLRPPQIVQRVRR